MHKNVYIAILTFLLAPSLLMAQRPFNQNRKFGRENRSLDLGIFIGGSNYSGELAKEYVNWNETNFAAGLFTRYNASPHISLRASFNWGRVSGADANYEDDRTRYLRNLSFRSDIVEFNGLIEYNLLPLVTGKNGTAWSPYIFGGVALFKFNPKAYYNDEWIELQPLATEGQGTTKYNERKKYNLTEFSIPFGAGVKFQITPKWALGLEFGWRKTFTDYIDDISKTYIEPELLQAAYGNLSRELADRSGEVNDGVYLAKAGDPRGNPKTKDWYMMGGLTISYKVFGKRVRCFSFN